MDKRFLRQLSIAGKRASEAGAKLRELAKALDTIQFIIEDEKIIIDYNKIYKILKEKGL